MTDHVVDDVNSMDVMDNRDGEVGRDAMGNMKF